MERNEYIPPEEVAKIEYGKRIKDGILTYEILDDHADVVAVGSSTKELTKGFEKLLAENPDQPPIMKPLGDKKRFADRPIEQLLRAGRVLAKMLKKLNPKADPHHIVKSQIAWGNEIAVIDEDYVKEWEEVNKAYVENQKKLYKQQKEGGAQEGDEEIVKGDKLKVLNVQRDGIITNLREYPLYMGTSDAPAVVLFDPVNKAVGIFHAGIYSFMNKILESGISKMKEQYGTDPSQLIAVISPCISSENYTVDDQVEEEFMRKIGDKGAKHIKPSTKKEGQNTIDLLGAIRESLRDSGIPDDSEHIQASEFKTDVGDKFPSARAEGKKADSFGTMVVLK